MGVTCLGVVRPYCGGQQAEHNSKGPGVCVPQEVSCAWNACYCVRVSGSVNDPVVYINSRGELCVVVRIPFYPFSTFCRERCVQ